MIICMISSNNYTLTAKILECLNSLAYSDSFLTILFIYSFLGNRFHNKFIILSQITNYKIFDVILIYYDYGGDNMSKLLDRFETIFEVKRKKQSSLSIFFTFLLLLLVGNSLFFVMTYQKKAYDRYELEYQMVHSAFLEYHEMQGAYPVREPIAWKEEKDLRMFFEENQFPLNGSISYVDLDALKLPSEVKKTYLWDNDRNMLYTSQFVSYGLRRWHLPGAR